jgi:hypothetical protein
MGPLAACQFECPITHPVIRNPAKPGQDRKGWATEFEAQQRQN